ncbi:MAG: carboxypeptidase-like regulatory domain-containing protein [Planctomycetota bacterium]|nr:carboxypeptidase-like regulatory domain-containing protein [Planctomycetota bacterium]
MKPSSAILHKNLELLLKRAYVPALARPEFRARLLASCATEIERLADERRRPARIHRGPHRASWIVLGAAAAALLVWLAWPFATGKTTSPEDLLQTGGAQVVLEPGEALPRDGKLIVESPDRERLAEVDGSGGRRLADTAGQRADAPVDTPDAVSTTSIAGVVRDAETEAPVTSFRVLLLAEGEVPETDEPLLRGFDDDEGRFLWEGFPPGRFEVFVQADGYAQLALPRRELADGSPVEITASLEAGGTMRGWVVDAESGNPVPGAWVISETDAPTKMIPYKFEDGVPQWLHEWTTTGSDGSFELSHVASGEHVLRVSAPGYAPVWSGDVSVVADDTVEVPILELEGGGSITGRVTGPDGAPIHGAFVLASPIDQLGARGGLFAFGHATTDETGRYEIVDLHKNLFLVFQWASFEDCQTGDTPTLKPAGVSPDAPAIVDFLGHDGGTRVFGRFLDADGNPVANTKFSIVPKRNRGQSIEGMRASATNEDGNYAFVAPTAETYSLMLTYGMGAKLVLCAEIDVPELTEYEHDVLISRAGIRGTVTDGRNGEPIASAVILVERVDDHDFDHTLAGKTITDADGRYSLSGLVPGAYVVHSATIEADLGFSTSEQVILQGEDDEASVLDLALFPGGSLRVVVTDPEGEPVPGAIVELSGGPHGASCCQDADTNQAGMETLIGIRPGEHRLRVWKPGFEDAQAKVAVRAGEETLQAITLTPEDDS